LLQRLGEPSTDPVPQTALAVSQLAGGAEALT
jgi:hypothetical protein